jgi:hypothetical protein
MIPEGTSWDDGADAGHRPDLVVRDHGRSDPTPRTPDTRSTLHASTGPRAKVALNDYGQEASVTGAG